MFTEYLRVAKLLHDGKNADKLRLKGDGLTRPPKILANTTGTLPQLYLT